MLEPDGRTLLLDALRPPPGHTLDAAFGTTYSLDLVSMLTAPVAFAMFDRQRADGSTALDPIAMLQALREHSGRITLFHQAGQVAVPPIDQRLIVYLEKAVYPVVPPKPAAIFHPKVWYLRYRDTGTGSTSLRFLCLSRNLTADRSWDTILRLDGVPGQETIHPELSEFAGALIEMASRTHPLPAERSSAVRSLGADLAKARWTLPEGFDEIRFWPLGYDGQERWPFDGRIDRLLIISPFLSAGTVSALTKKRRGSVVLSRPESLDSLGAKALAHLAERLVLAADAVGESPEPDGDGEWQTADSPPPTDRLVGLHAKTYVADAGRFGRIWTGSANATDAAFHGNVEFLVELTGRNRDCGLQAAIGDNAARIGLRKIVEEYEPVGDDAIPPSEEEQLERRLDEMRRAIGGLRFTATCDPAPLNRWNVSLRGDQTVTKIGDLEGIEVLVWPATLGQGAAINPSIAGSLSTSFELSEDGVTPFFGVSVAAGDLRIAFVVVAELNGGPEGRVERVLGQILKDRAGLVRFLLLLLGNLDAALDWNEGSAGTGTSAGAWASAFESDALLEPLVRAYARDPERLRDVEHVLTELNRSGTGAHVLPERWDEIWQPIAEALLADGPQ